MVTIIVKKSTPRTTKVNLSFVKGKNYPESGLKIWSDIQKATTNTTGSLT